MLLWQTEDHDEGIAAFMEKRKPKYQGRGRYTKGP